METILGRLGSRFSLNFRPRSGQLWASPLGKLYDRPLRLEISVASNGARFVWPFSGGESIGFCTQEITMTSLTLRCVSDSLGLELFIKFIAPFYPQDDKLSIAPFVYMDVLCRPAPDGKKRSAGEVKVALFAQGDETVSREGSGILLRGKYRLARDVAAKVSDEFSSTAFAGTIALVPIRGKMTLRETTFSIPYSVDGGAETRATFVLAAYCGEPVLDVVGVPHRFRYVRWFRSLADVVSFAKDKEAEIMRKLQFFDDLFLRCSMGDSEKKLIAYSFQSFLSTTWWTESSAGGDDWFGCWDNQAFLNSMQSEFAASLFYLNLWPDLLEKQLNQRASLSAETGVFPSNLGRFLSVESLDEKAASIEDMCDYLLTMFAYWRWWDRFDPVEQNVPTLRMLGSLLLQSSHGQPKLSPDGTRQMLKQVCALEALALMADEFNDPDLSDECSGAERDIKTCLREREGLENRNSIQWVDGLLHHVICDSFPELDYARIRQIILSGKAGSDQLAISQNIRSDLVAAYLGVNYIRKAQRYWDSQVSENVGGCAGCYVDSPGSHSLSCDPRGAALIGILQALIGLKLDRVERTLTISPVSIPSSMPILPLAYWEAGRVPWAHVRGERNQVTVDVSEYDLVDAAGELSVDAHRDLRCGAE